MWAGVTSATPDHARQSYTEQRPSLPWRSAAVKFEDVCVGEWVLVRKQIPNFWRIRAAGQQTHKAVRPVKFDPFSHECFGTVIKEPIGATFCPYRTYQMIYIRSSPGTSVLRCMVVGTTSKKNQTHPSWYTHIDYPLFLMRSYELQLLLAWVL